MAGENVDQFGFNDRASGGCDYHILSTIVLTGGDDPIDFPIPIKSILIQAVEAINIDIERLESGDVWTIKSGYIFAADVQNKKDNVSVANGGSNTAGKFRWGYVVGAAGNHVQCIGIY